jgi:transcriptional regulator with GAF, ATPase, and Fis domain
MQPNSRSAYLIIRQGNRWSDVFRLEKGRSLVIGRASSNEIPVADERASRRHAEVFFQDGEWWIRDLGSRNGTFLDGRRIDAPQPLTAGSQLAVASCRGTFVHSLEDFIPPPIENDEGDENGLSKTQSDISPAITHRQSKASLLESRSLHPSELAGATASNQPPQPPGRSAPMREPSMAGSPVAIELLQLAFELAQQATVTDACDLALVRLMQTTGCQSGGILRLDRAATASAASPPAGSNAYALTILAAREQSGRAYHPISHAIVDSLQREPSAILARNVASDPQLLGDHAKGASHVHSTTSIVAAPLRIEEQMFGLVHLYSRDGEPDLKPEDLEVALAIADVLSVSIKNLMRQQSLETKLKSTHERINELEQQLGHGEWIGNSNAMRQVREQVAKVAPTQATVLIRGESGTGKELVAKAIHDLSPRVSGPFIAINCAALTPTLLESELFGHEKGAFTGATERKLGKFELAHTGTLMLDELGEMSMEIQAKFLRVLEAKVFERVGSGKPIHVDVRVIAATNRDLEQAVRDGAFRSDLYFRLRVIELSIPPLRLRTEDILPLANFFLKQFRARSGHGPVGFSPNAERAMLEYHWPGNVRELRNCVERAHVLAPGTRAEPDDLALSHLQVPHRNGSPTRDENPAYRERTLQDLEQEHIEATLKHTGGQKNRAATILGIERSTLDRKLKRMLEEHQ